MFSACSWTMPGSSENSENSLLICLIHASTFSLNVSICCESMNGNSEKRGGVVGVVRQLFFALGEERLPLFRWSFWCRYTDFLLPYTCIPFSTPELIYKCLYFTKEAVFGKCGWWRIYFLFSPMGTREEWKIMFIY